MDEIKYEIDDDGTITFPATGHRYRVRSFPRGKPAVTLESDHSILASDRIDLQSAKERQAYAAGLNGHAGAVERELLALSQLMDDLMPGEESHGDKPPKASQADLVVDLAKEARLFHDPDGEGYATIPVDGHWETWPLKSKGFRRWLAQWFYEENGKTPGAQAMQDALMVLEGKALFNGPEYPVPTRIASHEGKLYLDLVNERWEAVEISPDGWRVVSDLPVKFRRARGMLSLPTPTKGGALDDLRPFVNLAADADWHLYIAWLLAAFRPTGPYPILAVHGEQGSAKTTLSRMARRLIDPNSTPLRSEPREIRDVMIAAKNGWIVGYDNLSRLPDWLSDCLCRLSTGGGFSTRELYSDSDEILFEAQRPVALNGIEELATRADLLDRAIVLYLAAIPEEKRRTESTFWKEFEAAQPGILGALLDVVSQALKRLPNTKLEKLPRMADFALWGSAAEEALGWKPGSFMAAYTQNRRDANDLSLEASPVAEAIQKFMSSRAGWCGTSTELLAELNQQADEEKRKVQERLKVWPTSGRGLRNTLQRLAPNLRQAGVSVAFIRTKSKRTIELEQVGNHASPASPASPPGEKPHGDADFENPMGDASGDAGDGSAGGGDASAASLSPQNSASGRGKSGKGDAGDADDAKKRTHSKTCVDCKRPSSTYRCSACAAVRTPKRGRTS